MTIIIIRHLLNEAQRLRPYDIRIREIHIIIMNNTCVCVIHVRCGRRAPMGFTGNRLTTVPRTGLKVVGEVYMYVYCTRVYNIYIHCTRIYNILTVFFRITLHTRARARARSD